MVVLTLVKYIYEKEGLWCGLQLSPGRQARIEEMVKSPFIENELPVNDRTGLSKPPTKFI